MTPAWSLTADGADLTAALAKGLLSLTVTDQAGIEADTLELTVADPRAELALPALGATLTVALGYQGADLVTMGSFLVDTLELSSPPRTLRITAHGADLTAALRDRRTEDHEEATVGSVVGTIAARHGLTPAVAGTLSGRRLDRIDQTNESDISFLTRLGELFDAIVTIKDGRCIFTPRAQGTSVSGQALGVIKLSPADLLIWRYSESKEDVPSTVEARVYDPETATDTRVSARVPAPAPGKLSDLFAAKEAKYGLPSGLLTGIAKTESSFNPNAIGPPTRYGTAKGMFQFIDGTARQYGVNPFDPASAADGAARYLRDLHQQFGSWDKAIAAYNAGPGNISKGVYPPETRAYVPKVKKAMGAAVEGGGAKVQLRGSFADRELAQIAATSAATAAARNSRTLSLLLPGRPALAAETPLDVSGLAAEIDGRWFVGTATHRLDPSGYVTEVEASPQTEQAQIGPTIDV